MWYDAIAYNLPTKKYLVVAVGTGHYWGKCNDEDTLTSDMYIGTVLLAGGSLVLHYFLVDIDKLNFKFGLSATENLLEYDRNSKERTVDE